MKLGIHGKSFDKEQKPAIYKFLHRASESSELFISEKFVAALAVHGIDIPNTTFRVTDDPRELDALVTFGGDGTILEAVAHIAEAEIPILGINTGRLGFLSETSGDKMDHAYDLFFDGRFTLDKRMLLRLETSSEVFPDHNFALNDFTLLKKDSSSMIVVHAYIDGEFLNSYWSDGLIVATPTGSTGYSLSCGGPILLPDNENFIITPVSPHNLTARPMVVSSESIIELRIEGRQKNFLVSLDSRYRTVDASVDLKISKESFYAKLIRLEGSSYFETLRHKLNWGKDVRN